MGQGHEHGRAEQEREAQKALGSLSVSVPAGSCQDSLLPDRLLPALTPK